MFKIKYNNSLKYKKTALVSILGFEKQGGFLSKSENLLHLLIFFLLSLCKLFPLPLKKLGGILKNRSESPHPLS
jgi:hypothetical protein